MSRKWGLVLVLMLVSAAFTILIPTHSLATEPTRVYVDPPSIVDPPTFFNVSVKIDNVQNLVGIQLYLNWNPSLLYAASMTDVIFHETTPQSEWDNIWILQHQIDNLVGQALYVYTWADIPRALSKGYAPISGNYTIFVLQFQVRGVGNSTLHFDISKLSANYGVPIVHDTLDGFFSNSIPPPPIPPSPPSNAQIKVYVDPGRITNETLAVNSTFSVSIRLDNIGNDKGIMWTSFRLDWNSTILECINTTEVMLHDAAPVNEWFNIYVGCEVDNTRGNLTFVSWYWDDRRGVSLGYDPAFGNQTLAILTFRVKNIGKSLLTLRDIAAFDGKNNFLLYAVRGGFFANTLTGDLNGDGIIDLYDALLFSQSFGARVDSQSWNEDADINGDGVVDIYDAIALCNCFGHTR